MEKFNISEIRQNLEKALSRNFDTSCGIAVYGAGETSTRYSEIFVGDSQNMGGGTLLLHQHIL